MRQPGMAKAREALRRARAASLAMRKSTGPNDFLISWSSFLSEFQITFNMMYAAVDESDNKETHWKDKVMTARQKDPVLTWITAARHIADHKLAFEITITPPSKFRIGLIPENSNDPADIVDMFSLTMPYQIVPNALPSWIKKEKNDQACKLIDPPDSHRGKSLRNELNCYQLWGQN